MFSCLSSKIHSGYPISGTIFLFFCKILFLVVLSIQSDSLMDFDKEIWMFFNIISTFTLPPSLNDDLSAKLRVIAKPQLIKQLKIMQLLFFWSWYYIPKKFQIVDRQVTCIWANDSLLLYRRVLSFSDRKGAEKSTVFHHSNSSSK